MKKLLVAVLVLAMMFALVGCGTGAAEEISLVEVTTEEGISMLMPSDLTLEAIEGTSAYINAETGESIVIAKTETFGSVLSEMTEEDILLMYQAKHDDVVVESFENGIQISGKDALVTSVTFTSEGGNPLMVTLVLVMDDEYDYVINFTADPDPAAGTLASNIDACLDSITIAE